MALPLSWKLAGAVTAVIVVALTWHGVSLYVAARHADELTLEVARNAEREMQLARARAQQRSAELTASLKRQRDDLANTYREVREDAAKYQVEKLRREEAQREEALRLQASYELGPNQKCADGIVINRSGSSFTQAIGSEGQPIKCSGGTAEQPLR